jgi:hypothetical protein
MILRWRVTKVDDYDTSVGIRFDGTIDVDIAADNDWNFKY